METEKAVVFSKGQVTEHGLSMEVFHEKSHLWGRLTIWLVIALSVMLPLYLSFVSGFHPGWQTIITAFVAYAAMIGYAWVIEPISYYPTLGVSGTYLAFLTGNISSMCLPAAATAQNAIGVEPGTKKGEITATLAIAAASLVNIVITSIIILFGSYLISIIPESIQSTFQFIIPAIFGGVMAQFAMKKPLYGIIAIVFGVIINILPIIAFFKGIVCIALTVVVCLYLEKMKIRKQFSE